MDASKIRLVLVLALLLPTAGASAAGATTQPAQPARLAGTAPAPDAVSTPLASSTASIGPVHATLRPGAVVAQSSVLGRGDQGADVRELQQRLRDLRFWVGDVDGDFGWLTEQAVYAFQKANGITVDGLVGPQTRAALADPTVPVPRSDQGRAVEIDKPRQLLYAVGDGQLEWVFHTSTGTEEPYEHPAGYTALADTPPGEHSVFWEVDRWQEGVLGPLYRPKYFHEDGIAVHGDDDVPPYPVSHGCVRVTFAAMDYIWANDLMPMGSTVLVY